MTDRVRIKRGEAESYDQVAESFARWSRRSTAPVARRLVAMLEGDARRVLDLGCGSGAVAEALGRGPGRRRQVIGVDLSLGLLATASRDLGDALRPVFADAETLPVADEAVDAVVCLFALMHFPSPDRALREAWRVLRPGAPILVAVGGGAPRRLRWLPALVRRAAQRSKVRAGLRVEAMEAIDTLVSRRLPASPSERGVAGALSFGERRGLAREVRRAGFVDVSEDWISGDLEVTSAVELWELASTFSTLARRRLAEADADSVRSIREEFEALCGRVLTRGGVLAYPVGARVVRGRRPAGR